MRLVIKFMMSAERKVEFIRGQSFVRSEVWWTFSLDKNNLFCSCLSVGVCCGQLFYGAQAQHGAVAGPRKFRNAPP